MTPSTQSVLRRLWSWCPLIWVRHIPRELGQRYLDRYSLFRQRPSGANQRRVYLHAFHAPDSEGHHSHPCRWGGALVLRGSYTEEILTPGTCRWHEGHPYSSKGYPDYDFCIGGACDRVRTRTVRWFNWVPASKYHRIVALHPRRPGEAVWTLFFMGPLAHNADGALSGWGFHVAGRGHVDHAVREAERAADAAESLEAALARV